MNVSDKKKIVSLAKQIVDGTIGIIEGCRLIVSLKIYPIEDPNYRIIMGVESGTDEFPIGDVRQHYSEESLEKLDKELNKYIESRRLIILEACKNLLKKYSD